MNGKIVFVGLNPKHAFEKVIRREMDRWVTHEKRPPEAASYEVKISSEDSGHFFYCRVEAKIGGCRFLANEGGKTPLDAFAKTLKHVRVQRLRVATVPADSLCAATVA